MIPLNGVFRFAIWSVGDKLLLPSPTKIAAFPFF
jgi:hypothetical protein